MQSWCLFVPKEALVLYFRINGFRAPIQNYSFLLQGKKKRCLYVFSYRNISNCHRNIAIVISMVLVFQAFTKHCLIEKKKHILLQTF